MNRTLILSSVFAVGLFQSAFADNIANCEIVLMERVEDENLEGGLEVASLRPADDFLESVYDDDIPLIRKVDDLPIRALMCERQTIIPSLRDYPLLETGIPFYLSQNFDSDQSGLLTLFFKAGKFQYLYKGRDLSEAEEAELEDRMEIFNLQPNALADKEKAMNKKPEPEPEPAAKVETEADIETETKVDVEIETQPESEAELQPVSDTKPEPKSDPDPESEPDNYDFETTDNPDDKPSETSEQQETDDKSDVSETAADNDDKD